MKQRILAGIVFLFVVSSLIGSGQATLIPAPYGCTRNLGTHCNCDVTLVSIDYKNQVNPAENIIITAVFDLTADGGSKCDFMLEASVQPQIQAASIIEASNPICCAFNNNYAGTTVSVDNRVQSVPKTERKTIQFYLKAPYPGSIDHCPPNEGKSYWNNYGTYDVIIGSFNGCWKDLNPMGAFRTIYWNRNNKIVIEELGTCGDGACVNPETPENCIEDCAPDCLVPGCQNPAVENMYCPEQCGGATCGESNCPPPFFQCMGNSCQPNWMLIGGIIGIIAIVGIVYYVRRNK